MAAGAGRRGGLRPRLQRHHGAMYEEWPTLEFPELTSTVLDLFSRESGEDVAYRLLAELVPAGTPTSAGKTPAPSEVSLQSEDQLRWTMQVFNFALALPLTSEKQKLTAGRAVQSYVHWLRALTASVDSSIPRPLIETPEKYFRGILDALRSIYVRRKGVVNEKSVERQSELIQAILEATRTITREAREKYQDEVWSRSLAFSLNAADILLAPPVVPKDVSCRVGSAVIDSLFGLWMRAVAEERIPSPTYWKTLAVLASRWKHHVTVIESWSRTLLALSVLVTKAVYGDSYCTISVANESMRAIATSTHPALTTTSSSASSISIDGDADERTRLLFETWTNVFSLFPSPSEMLDEGKKEEGGGEERDQLPLCFFIAATTVQRMVDIFYGDNRVQIASNACEAYFRDAKEKMDAAAEAAATSNGVVDGSGRTLSSLSAGANTTPSLAATTPSAGPPTRTNSDMKANRTARNSDRSLKGGLPPPPSSTTPSAASGGGGERELSGDSGAGGGSSSASSAVFRRATSLSSTGEKVTPPISTASLVVAHALARCPALRATSNERAPRSSRMLDLTMAWLLEAATAAGDTERHLTDGRAEKEGRSSRVNFHPYTDVTSTISQLSGDTAVDEGEVVDERSKMHHHRNHMNYTDSERRKSAGAGSIASTSSFAAPSPRTTTAVDGAEAGRAAALAALARIVCAKTTREVIPEEQLAQFLAAVNGALVQKEHLVLCALFFHGHGLFRLGLPGVEALLPAFLAALDVVLETKNTNDPKDKAAFIPLRLHPSMEETEMRRACLRALSTVVAWPTTFGIDPIPQLPSSSSSVQKSSTACYLHLRQIIIHTLKVCLRNETDGVNLQLALAMCTILCEEAALFDLGMSEEERKELLGPSVGKDNGTTGHENAHCSSLVRGVVSAVCDRICTWSSDFPVCMAAMDVLNSLSTIHPSILFHSKDLSTGMLIISSLCRFVQTQLGKPPPCQSRDLHSSVVAAFQSIGVWLMAAPLLAECESVLTIVAETIQLGKEGVKRADAPGEAKPASKRVSDAAVHLMYTMFAVVGRPAGSVIMDERRLLHLFGPSAIDTTRFHHYLINGDTLLSVHEACHIPTLAKGCAAVIYVRRSPFHPASVGYARLKPRTDGPPAGSNGDTLSVARTPLSRSSASSVPASTPVPGTPTFNSAAIKEAYNKARAFQLPADFNNIACKVDALYKPLESTRASEEMLLALQNAATQENIPRSDSAWARLRPEEKIPRPKDPVKTCNSVRVFLHDLGLTDIASYGSELVPLDAGQSSDFYRDLHGLVDSSPSSALCTGYIFYVRDGQRSALDILENGMNLQSLAPEFLTVLSTLGEGVEVGVHEGWTGHWNTAFSSERKPVEERDGVDHYVLDGVSHVLWRGGMSGVEMAFVTPTQRAVRHFKQELPPVRSSRSGGASYGASVSFSSDPPPTAGIASPRLDHNDNDDVFVPSTAPSSSSSARGIQPYSGGGSSMGGAPPPRRSASDLRILLVWLERGEDAAHFPLEELLCTCDDGGEKTTGGGPSTSHGTPSGVGAAGHSPGARSQSSSTPSSAATTTTAPIPHIGIFFYEIEPGLVHVRTRGTPMRFGSVGPLVEGAVVSTAALPALIRLTLANLTRRNVAEVENFTHAHVRRRSNIGDFAKKYTLQAGYEEFLTRLIQ